MKYEIIFTSKAKAEFLILERNLQKRIAGKLRFFVDSGNPLQYAKKLKDFRLGAYRFRVGDYRIIFDLDKNGEINILMILRIKHRKDVYED